MTFSSSVSSVFLLGVALLLSGCNRDAIRVYEVSKDEPVLTPVSEPRTESTRNGGGLPPGHPDTAQANPLASFHPDEVVKASPPQKWEAAGPDQVNFTSFSINEGDLKARVSVTPLPTEYLKDREAEAVNIWRQQMGLPELGRSELEGQGKAVAIGPVQGKLFDYSSEGGSAKSPKRRVLVAYATRGNTVWYFKLMGDEEIVTREASAFLGYLKSVEFAAAPREATQARPAAESESGGGPKLKAPAGWQAIDPPPMAVAGYRVGSDGKSATVSISQAGGSLLMNYNRWRGQLGLGEASDAEFRKAAEPIEGTLPGAIVVDLAGNRQGKPTRIVGAMVPQGGATWFYKMTGDPDLVAREKGSLVEVVKSARYDQ